jgi:hypothetical protein
MASNLILSWMKKEPKREILLKAIKAMETKVKIQRDPCSEEVFKKLNNI